MPAWTERHRWETDETPDPWDIDIDDEEEADEEEDDEDIYAKCIDDEGGILPCLEDYELAAFGDEFEPDEFDLLEEEEAAEQRL